MSSREACPGTSEPESQAVYKGAAITKDLKSPLNQSHREFYLEVLDTQVVQRATVLKGKT